MLGLVVGRIAWPAIVGKASVKDVSMTYCEPISIPGVGFNTLIYISETGIVPWFKGIII